MADKAIGELIAAEKVNQSDLFVLEQDGAAKKLTGQILENWLLAMAQGHGGIQSIDKVGTSGLVDTYRITLADTASFDFPVTNGKSITGVKKSGTAGLVDTYTISYNDGSTSAFSVTNGAKGDKGDNAYTWIKYASQEPTESSHSMGDIPDEWRGEYNGPLAEAPTDWKQYKWYKIKGEKGATGDPATLMTKSVTYQVSDSGMVIPSGSWLSAIPNVPQGKYLWTRTVVQFNTGDPVTSYTVARMGIDGTGAVSTVAGVSPDATGNVTLTAADVGALAVSGGDVEGPINMNGQTISGLNDPTEDTQAARKGYVDAAKSAANAYTDASVRKAAPRNLLDNSDFRNPVNQRNGKLVPPGVPYYVYAGEQVGTTSTYCTVTKTIGNLAFIIIDGNEYVADTSTMVDGYSGPVYTIDRWRITNKYSSVTVDDDGVTFSANGSMCYPQQLIVANTNMVGKTFTAAICLKDGSATVTSGVLTALSPASNTLIGNMVAITNGNGAELAMYARTDGNLMIQPHIPDGVSLGLRWAALYEGSYTAETLPEYHPKGYGAELAECQRYYYRNWDGGIAVEKLAGVYAPKASRTTSIVFPVTMRATPSITLYNPASGNKNCVGDWETDADVSANTAYVTNHQFMVGGNVEASKMYSYLYEATADL